MSDVGNWIGVQTNTIGTGQISLGAPVPTFTDFDSYGDGDYYYAIIDGENRESGECTVTGTAMDRRPSYTLFEGNFSGGNPAAIPLSGVAEVYCTFNKDAFDLLASQIQALVDVQAAYLLLDGSLPMGGPLVLSGDATLALQAVTYQQMLAAIAASPGGGGPTLDWLLRDGSQDMLGLFGLAGDAVQALEPTTLQQVQSLIAAIPGASLVEKSITYAAAAGAVNLDAELGATTVFIVELAGAVTLDIINIPVTADTAYACTIKIVADGSAVTWDAKFNWGTDGAPTLTLTPGEWDLVVTFVDSGDATSYDSKLAIGGLV